MATDDGRTESDLPSGLDAPTRRALSEIGITNLEQLSRVTEAEVLALHGIGPKGIDKMRVALAARGLSFRQPD